MPRLTRRNCLTSLAAAATATTAAAQPAAATRSILLHCDLAVDPKREQEMLDYFEKTFRPVARKHTGYIDLKMLKLKSAIRGAAPLKYRFALNYQSEELRQKWIASADHQRVWPPIENMLTNKEFSITIFDVY